MPDCRRGLNHLCLQLMIGAFLLDAGLAEAAEINCPGTAPVFSDCLIVTTFADHPRFSRTRFGELTDLDEAAGKPATVTLPRAVFDFVDRQGISDIFRISTVRITLESDPGFTKPPPAGFLSSIAGETTEDPAFTLRVISDLDPPEESRCPAGSNECVLAIIAGIPVPLPLAVLSESAPEAMTGRFPGLVIDFTEPASRGTVIGDRLTISPFTFTFISDAERRLRFQRGRKLPFERANIFQVLVRSDTRPEVPEPGSFFLFATGALACIGLRSRVFYRQNRLNVKL